MEGPEKELERGTHAQNILYEKILQLKNSREKMLLFDLGFTYPSYIFLYFLK